MRSLPCSVDDIPSFGNRYDIPPYCAGRCGSVVFYNDNKSGRAFALVERPCVSRFYGCYYDYRVYRDGKLFGRYKAYRLLYTDNVLYNEPTV